MIDMLDIPEFLRRTETPEEATKRRKRMRHDQIEMRPTTKADHIRRNYDREGRLLPREMDEGSWALLRSLEKDAVAKERAEKTERFRLLKIEREEKRRIKAEAKAAKAEVIC
jgi:hypothetical protein